MPGWTVAHSWNIGTESLPLVALFGVSTWCSYCQMGRAKKRGQMGIAKRYEAGTVQGARRTASMNAFITTSPMRDTGW